MTDYDPQEPGTLSGMLWAYVDVYWNEYREYWELVGSTEDNSFSDDQRELHRGLDRIGEAMRRTIRSLSPDAASVATVNQFFQVLGIELNADPANAAKTLRTMHKQPIVRDCLAISLALEAVDTLLPAAEGRAAELVALIASRQMSHRASAYLERATKLYLWGFDPECVIMCRSVLEAALSSRLATFLAQDEAAPTLDKLVAIAGERGVLPGYKKALNRRRWNADRGSLLEDADNIRRAGNHLIHDLPDLTIAPTAVADSATAVRTLARVLDHLFPEGNAS